MGATPCVSAGALKPKPEPELLTVVVFGVECVVRLLISAVLDPLVGV